MKRTRKTKKWINWLAGVSFVLLAMGAVTGYWLYRPLRPGDPETGKDLYQVNCVPCHGIKGDGNGPKSYFIVPPPRNFADPDEMAKVNTEQKLIAAVTGGKDGTAMLSWQDILTEQQIRDVVAYVRTFLKESHSAQPNSQGKF